jgi:hypothetical protein
MTMTRYPLASRPAVLAAAGLLALAAASGAAYGAGKPGDGPQTTRTIPWPGGDTLGVSVGADVRYTQGPNTGLVATGRKATVDNLVIVNGNVRFARWMPNSGDLVLVLTAPDVRRFKLAGSNSLSVNRYDQESLELSISGSGDADLNGKTRRVDLSISGSGEIDAAGLAAADAKINISGSGDAKVGPTQSADINISGSGDVELTSSPAKLNSKVSGSGSVKTR